jgi:flavin-dependent dehydrogenase
MQHDVAIIGGGLAGCAAALALLARGQSVVVIASPNHREKPTETAAPQLASLLGSISATEALRACEPCYGIVSAWGTHTPALKPAIVNPYGHAWFIHRSRFDACIQKAARRRGAKWLTDEAYSLTPDVNGVTVSTSGTIMRVRWAVIATGSPSSSARLTVQTVNSVDSMIAFWVRLPARYGERTLRVEPTDDGWWYLCPADGPGTIACLVTDGNNARDLRPADAAKWNALFRATDFHRKLKIPASAESIHVALTGLASLPQTHGPRWIAVGDAAAKLDPLGSSGIATALDSGQRAANAIADALQGSNNALDNYGHWSVGLVTEFIRQRRRQYALEADRYPAGFWPRRLALAA